MPNLPKLLTVEEKKFLLAVERGDMANVKRMLQQAQRKENLDINCVDSLGRGALTISIDQENLEMVELLIIMGVQTKDALLHAINVEFVEAVELLLEHEELIHTEGEPYSWQTVDSNTASFTPDITPLILAAHRNNYEILKILLDRGATLPMPHDIKCGCDECITLSQQDSLRQALSRLNEYKALASPSLIALTSSDPILTAFQLSWELRSLAFAEPECKSEYLDLRRQCQQFAVDLLHQSRSSQELAIILNHDPDDPTPYKEGDHMRLSRLELAIQYKQKKFVSHPNIQQLLAAIWYEGVPGFRRKSSLQKIGIIVKVALLFPFYCMLYIVAPTTETGKLMRKPFMKFLIHASSYLFFLLILILVSQRAEDFFIEIFGTESWKESVVTKYERQRGNPPMLLEYVVLIYVIGFIFEEAHEMYSEGFSHYIRNLWNIIDFSRNFLYTAVFFLRVAAYLEQNSQITQNPGTAYLRREEWAAFDFQLVAEGLFAAANIFSALKLVHLFSINPHLGPLQISLGRMVIDIVKFFFIYSLVLFAFACGLNQLLWYFSDLERQKCFHLPNGNADFANFADSCMKWRRFANVFESSQSLFWASFGLVDLSSFELTGIKTYTRFWGLLMFGSYSVINVIVLLNLLIAMMSNSYAIIEEHSDTEWKFARTKLWLSYFEESATLPPPFNLIPTSKLFLKLLGLRRKDKLRKLSSKRRNREEKERDYKYSAVMRALVWRYVATKHRKVEENPVTEDDVNELKSDISSFRYEILEVLHRNGMDTSSADRKEKAILGKRNKVWERRLMKDFKVGPIATEDEEELLHTPPQNETATARFRRIAKLAILNSGMNKWRQVIRGACIASQIGHCHNRQSFKKQQNLQQAILAAQKFAEKSPEASRSVTPINLPDTTALNIFNIMKDFDGINSNLSSPFISQEPLLHQLDPDLINLSSNQTSPITQNAGSPSFKHILGKDFSSVSTIEVPINCGPNSSIASKQTNKESTSATEESENAEKIKSSAYDEQLEIKDVMQHSTLIFSSGLVQPETTSQENPEGNSKYPEFQVTGTDGRHIDIRSPILPRKFNHDTFENFTPGSNDDPEEIGISTTTLDRTSDSDGGSKLKNAENNLRENSSDPNFPKVGQLDSTNSSGINSKSIPSLSLPLQHQGAPSAQSESEKEKMYSIITEEDVNISTNDKAKHTEENIAELSRVKGPTVTFSPILEDEQGESSELAKPIAADEADVLSKTPLKSSLKAQRREVPIATTLSPNVPTSPSISSDGKSPLASRNIHRVPKKYQPKFGWL
ncbi:transient-receptor-potential-like protein [Coccinella septempunctata]|uniref:transient-receptor-potential-like protein n=1 Tax=Coccinella septempunctata TaxID=41139 RepID=UPI001D083D69|nr:transient-receptor-potential-like protein [Coccinella septempunctata]